MPMPLSSTCALHAQYTGMAASHHPCIVRYALCCALLARYPDEMTAKIAVLSQSVYCAMHCALLSFIVYTAGRLSPSSCVIIYYQCQEQRTNFSYIRLSQTVVVYCIVQIFINLPAAATDTSRGWVCVWQRMVLTAITTDASASLQQFCPLSRCQRRMGNVQFASICNFFCLT